LTWREPVLALLLAASACRPLSAATAEFQVSPKPVTERASRIGVNLGFWTSWGAEQLSANVLKNPGFEGICDSSILIVGAVGARDFTDDVDWAARDPGFWDGARYQILTGRLQGRQGVVYRSTVVVGKTRIETNDALYGLAVGDAVALTRIDDTQTATQWWFEGSGVAPDRTQKRPGSPGVRSLRIIGPGAAKSYLDAIGDRAGKLLPLRGTWKVSVWAKAASPGTPLHILLRRNGAPTFFDQTVPLTASWKQYAFTIHPSDTGPAGALELRFESTAATATAWLDDAALMEETPVPGAFRPELVETLKTIRPGYLRDWQGQLGDTLANRMAPAAARRATRYRPGGAEATDYDYSLPDFLQLAQQVKAVPWIVLSPALTFDEWREAGRLLSAEADRRGFPEILIEYGNENWNNIFRTGGIPNDATLTAAAKAAFAQLLAGANGDHRLRPVLGGQFYFANRAESLAKSAPASSITAFAPYWAFEPKSADDLFPDAIAPELAKLASLRETAVYEMNAHSLNGNGSAAEINRLLDGPEGGAAIAWNAIGALNAGLRRICIFSIAQFDTNGAGKDRLIHLFGITRDLADANHFRPEGNALALLNTAVAGDLYQVQAKPSNVRIAVFRTPTGWRVAAASKSPNPEQIHIAFPAGPTPLPDHIQALDNAAAQIRQGPNSIEVALPPYGFAIATHGVAQP